MGEQNGTVVSKQALRELVRVEGIREMGGPMYWRMSI